MLATRLPVDRVVVTDIDGDGHVEIIASDTSARVHVWRKSARGGLKPTKPKPHPHASTISSDSHLDGLPDSPDGGVPSTGASAPPADGPHPAASIPPSLSSFLVPAGVGPTGAGYASHHRLRGPPLR